MNKEEKRIIEVIDTTLFIYSVSLNKNKKYKKTIKKLKKIKKKLEKGYSVGELQEEGLLI